jgi:hypothetical protein
VAQVGRTDGFAQLDGNGTQEAHEGHKSTKSRFMNRVFVFLVLVLSESDVLRSKRDAGTFRAPGKTDKRQDRLQTDRFLKFLMSD